jgi:hypothetical protein
MIRLSRVDTIFSKSVAGKNIVQVVKHQYQRSNTRLKCSTYKTLATMEPKQEIQEREAKQIHGMSVSNHLEESVTTVDASQDDHEHNMLTRRLLRKLDTRCLLTALNFLAFSQS